MHQWASGVIASRLQPDAWAVHFGSDAAPCKSACFDRGRATQMAVQLHGTLHAMAYLENIMQLDARSERNLTGVHHALVDVVHRAADIVADRDDGLGMIVTEGLRTRERQVELVRVGASQTMDSRHLTGHAVDLAATVGGSVRWDWPLYQHLADAMKSAATEQGTQIDWGGDWVHLRDGPHFQLAAEVYRA